MDSFDTGILNLLRHGEPRQFEQILAGVVFRHKTLRPHLSTLVDQELRVCHVRRIPVV